MIQSSPDTLALLRRRRSVAPAALAGPGPTPEQLDVLLGIAMRVPDHGKLTPWRFIVFEGEGRLRAGQAIAEVCAQDAPQADVTRLAQEGRRLAQAPLVVGVVSAARPHVKIPEWEQQMSAAAAATLLVVAANAMGFSTAWLTEWPAYDRRVLARLGLAAHERMTGFIHIGSAAARPEDRPRPRLEDKVTRF